MTGAMFQSFETPGDWRGHGRARGAPARGDGAARIDAVLVPHADEYMNEYVPPSAQRLAWLTGFTGSAGLAVVTRNAAALFVDGRYVLQAPKQVDTKTFEVLQIPAAKISDWIGKHLKAGATVGFDPRLHAPSTLDELEKELGAKRIKLKALAQQPDRSRLGPRSVPPRPRAR